MKNGKNLIGLAFGVAVFTLLINLLLLPYAAFYWAYKLFYWLFTVGRK